MKPLKRYVLPVVTLTAAVAVAALFPAKRQVLTATSINFTAQMLSFIPAVLLLTALLDVWVPKRVVETNVGPGSGLRGILITIAVAASAAGPLYIAFPLAQTLLRKGARLSNVVLFLNTWATIKIPMVLNEIRFVSWKFAVLRLILTIPAIILIGLLVEKACPAAAAWEERENVQ